MGARIKAYAKLNLTLSVVGSEGGYHMLDSLVCSVDLYDYITLSKRKDGRIAVVTKGMGLDFIPPEQNNAYRAAVLYQREFGCGGADITVYKNIPVGGGLGGSSADIAGVLRGMEALYGMAGPRLKNLADALGSDSGYMLNGGFARLFGRGEQVAPFKCNKKLHFLLLVPEGGVSAAECYSRYDMSPNLLPPSDGAISALLSGDLALLGKSLGNALYPAASAINPQINVAVEELKSFSPLGVCMTGSGSAVYALFPTAEMCAWAKSRYRGKFKCYQLKSV